MQPAATNTAVDESDGQANRRPSKTAAQRWFVIACFLLTSAPVVWAAAPPIMDYPNHLVRIWLLSGGAENDSLSSVYRVNWSQASTNIGLDLAAVQISRAFPFQFVDRLIRLLALIGPAFGAACLGRVVFARLTVWHVAPLAFVWGTTAVAGFLSYSVSLAAALVFSAAQVRINGKWARPVSHALFSAILLMIHPFGLFFYIVLMVGLTIGQVNPLALKSEQALKKAQAAIWAILIGIAPVALLMLSSKSAPGVSTIVHGGLAQFHPRTVIQTLISPVLSYNLILDVAFAAPLAFFALIMLFRKAWSFHFGLVTAALLLIIASVVAPYEIGEAAWVNRRFPLMAALTFAAAIHPKQLSARGRAAMMVTLLVSILGKAAWISNVWAKREQDLVDLRVVTNAIRAGDSIMLVKTKVAEGQPAPEGRLMADNKDSVRAHLPILLIMEKHALLPTLFAIPGQHPIEVRGLARSRERGMSSFVPYAPVVQAKEGFGYIPEWRCSYQYLLLIGADEPTTEPLDTYRLRLVGAQGFAALYAIERPPQGSDCD